MVIATLSRIQVPSTIHPAVASNSGQLQADPDGPPPPAGREPNWVETISGKSWFQLFRSYGPLQPWFGQTWKPDESEPLD